MSNSKQEASAAQPAENILEVSLLDQIVDEGRIALSQKQRILALSFSRRLQVFEQFPFS